MKQLSVGYFTKNISIAVGIILIWRGVWVVLDWIDWWIFGDDHIITAVLGIIFGVVILYLPEHNLKTLERL